MGANLFSRYKIETQDIIEEEELKETEINEGTLKIKGKPYQILYELVSMKYLKIIMLFCFSQKKYFVLKFIQEDSIKNEDQRKIQEIDWAKEEIKKEADMIKKISSLNPEKLTNGELVEVEYSNNKKYIGILMERGHSSLNSILESRIEKKQHYSEEELLYIFSNLIDCLDIMHKENFYHIDIKPHNIILKKNGHKLYIYSLCDFGSTIKSKKEIINTTPHYAPFPKDRTNIDLDKFDLYCLAISMIEIMVLKNIKFQDFLDFKNKLLTEFNDENNLLEKNYPVLYPILNKMLNFKYTVTKIQELIKKEKKIMPNEKSHKMYEVLKYENSLKNPSEHLAFFRNYFNLRDDINARYCKVIFEYINENEIKKKIYTKETALKLKYLTFFFFKNLDIENLSQILDLNEQYKFIQDPFHLNIFLIGRNLSEKGDYQKIKECTSHLYWYLEKCITGDIKRIKIFYFCLASILISFFDNEKSLKVIGLMNCYYRNYKAYIEENEQTHQFFFWFSICNFLGGKYESAIKYNVNTKEIERLEGNIVFILSYFMLKEYSRAYDYAIIYEQKSITLDRQFNTQFIYLVLHILNILADKNDNRNYKELFIQAKNRFENGNSIKKNKERHRIYERISPIFEKMEFFFHITSKLKKDTLHEKLVSFVKIGLNFEIDITSKIILLLSNLDAFNLYF